VNSCPALSVAADGKRMELPSLTTRTEQLSILPVYACLVIC
jgi:hypothetical protein